MPCLSDTLLIPLGQMAVLGEVEEAGELALEAESHCAGRAMALLGDDDLGLAARLVHLVSHCTYSGVPGFGSLFLR